MGLHQHHELTGTSLAAAARDTLEARGEQWTAMRATIYDALARAGHPVSAYDIADAVSAARGKRVAPNSVYRILDLFVGTNLATRIESTNAYIANPHPGCRHDCIFLVCQNCGATTHIDDDALARTMRARADREGFVTARPVIELLGLCAACSSARESAPQSLPA